MPPTSAAMELKVLINILSSGTALQTLLAQTNQLSTALTQLQTKSAAVPTSGGAASAAAVAQQLAAASQASAAGITAAGRAAMTAGPQLANLSRVMDGLVRGVRLLAGGFLAFQSVRMLKDWADTAARAETLQTVLRVVARNSGISAEKIDELDRRVQKLGITAASSRQSLTNMLSAGLNVEKAPLLARAAQDLAVIMGTDSSETLRRMVINIQQLDTVGLKWMGLIIDRTRAEKQFAKEIDKTGQALSKQEQQQALMNAVIEKAAEFAGVYETAMGNVGKQVQSLARFSTNLKVALGDILLPAYSAIVQELTLFYRQAELTVLGMQEQGQTAETLASTIGGLARKLREITEFLMDHVDWVVEVLKWWAAWRVAKFLAPGILTTLEILLQLMIELVAVMVASKAGFLTWWTGTTTAATGTAALTTQLTILSRLPMVIVFTTLAFAVMEFVRSIREANDAWKEGQGWQDYLKNKGSEQFATMTGAQYLPTGIQQWIGAKLGMNLPIGGPVVKSINESEEMAIARREAFESLRVELDATKRFTQAQKPEGTQIEYELADQALKDAKKVAEEKLEIYKKLIALDKITDPARKEFARTQLEAYANAKKMGPTLDRMMEAEKELFGTGKGFDPETGKVITQDAKQKADALHNLIDGVREMVRLSATAKEPLNLATQFRESGDRFAQGIRAMAQSAKEPMDLGRIQKGLDEFRAFAVEAGATQKQLAQVDADARQAMAIAQLGVRGAQRTYTGPLLEEQKRQLKDASDAAIELRQQALAQVKLLNEQEASSDKAKYDLGRIKFTEFYNNRLARIYLEDAASKQLGETQLANLEAQRAVTFGENLPALENQIQQQRNANDNERARFAEQRRESEQERETTRINLVKEILAGKLELAAELGSEKEARDVINNKYDEQIAKMKEVEGEEDLINANRNKELATVSRVFEVRRADEAISRTKAASAALELRQAELDRDKQRSVSLQKIGQLTTYEAMSLRNADTQNQLALDRQKLAAQDLLLAQLTAKETLARLQREQLIKDNYGENSEAVLKQNEIIRQTAAEIIGVQVAMEGLNAKIDEGTATLENYGRAIQEHFIQGFADALTKSIVEFKKAGDVWVSLSKSIANDIVSVFMKAFTERLFQKMGLFSFVDRAMDFIFGKKQPMLSGLSPFSPLFKAEGGLVSGPGTGTSDSVPAMLSAGEHVMPASKASTWMPLLEGIRTGRILPFAKGGFVQSIAMGSIVPRRYASGGMVVADGGASVVTPGFGGNMMVTLHPDSLNMTMREWLEHEVVRQHGRR